MLDALSLVQNSLVDLSPSAIFVALFFGTFVSEDATCLIAGAAVAAGETSLALAVSACATGIFVGDLALYGVGRFFGPPIFRARLIRRLVSEDQAHRVSSWLNRKTALAVFASRFVSGLRLPMYLASGALKTDATIFVFWFFVAAIVWAPLLVGAAALSVGLLSPGNLIVGSIATVVIVQLVRKLSTWTNRRLFVGSLKRITNWEFWPLAVFYAPVVCYIAWLTIRHRSITLFTAANPAMPAGGFVGESKDSIYRLLSGSRSAAKHILRHIRIESSEQLTERVFAVVSFIVKNRLTYPLVVKPDVGERGKGVRIVRDRAELAMAIKTADRDVIVQEYCGGVEASVFYYRLPEEEYGRVYSITEKRFPYVTGNGRSTIKALILVDDRAVAMAKNYFRQLGSQLGRVPEDGERVSLIDIGTHSRGAIFLEGDWLRTDALERVIDNISRGIDGFHFGRYDIRAESFDEMMAGAFKIIELNGVTSESTNIYDPRYSLIAAYRILFRQWRLAFEIGAVNRRNGIRPVTITAFAKLLLSRDASDLSRTDGDKLPSTHSPTSCA